MVKTILPKSLAHRIEVLGGWDTDIQTIDDVVKPSLFECDLSDEEIHWLMSLPSWRLEGNGFHNDQEITEVYEHFIMFVPWTSIETGRLVISFYLVYTEGTSYAKHVKQIHLES